MNIYIISAGDACKIGVAKDVENRIVALRTGSPHPLTVQHTMRCKNSRVAYKIEHLCHRVLADKRLEGEWFACTPMEAVIALNEAVLEFAANDLRYVDMPRGGEMALSSRAMRYVNAMCRGFGLKVADVVDEALVEHYGPIVDGRKNRDYNKTPKSKRQEVAPIPPEVLLDETFTKALEKGPIPISKLRTKRGIAKLSKLQFDEKICDLENRGYIKTKWINKGYIVSLNQGADPERRSSQNGPLELFPARHLELPANTKNPGTTLNVTYQ